MFAAKEYSLDAIRTDGWFERIGESVGSFQALCDIVGQRFFAFSMITGARITALTVDRRNPDNTLVDFAVGCVEGTDGQEEPQRLTLADFRRRLVSALLVEEPQNPAPTRTTDTESLQLYVGVRYLLLAPLYGYSLLHLSIVETGAELRLIHDGVEKTLELSAFRRLIRAHVREEMERASSDSGRGAIDLSKVKEAEEAADQNQHRRVIELLGAWPAPLTIFLRTPEGQMLNDATREVIAKALGLLGSACVAVGDGNQGEEVLRLAIQYAGNSDLAADIYARLGLALVLDLRHGEAIGMLRRAANLGAKPGKVWPILAQTFLERERYLAAYAAAQEGIDQGLTDATLEETLAQVRERLGAALEAFEAQAD
jgi:tetratricopeptide (TPR) repeat protein